MKQKNGILGFLKHNPLVFFLLFLTRAGELGHWPPLVIFVLACIAIIPMAAYIGEATETLAHFTSPRLGGLLNAALVSADGESSWLEGVALVAIYIILGLAFFLLPV